MALDRRVSGARNLFGCQAVQMSDHVVHIRTYRGQSLAFHAVFPEVIFDVPEVRYPGCH